MRQLIIVTVVLIFAAGSVSAQISDQSDKSPMAVVEKLWTKATEGQLLTPEGWRSLSELYTQPRSAPSSKWVQVMGNAWGPMHYTINGSSAVAVIGFDDAGKIDPALRYVPPKPNGLVGTGMEFHLVLTSAHQTTFTSGAKAVDGEAPDPRWQIAGSPGTPQGMAWTTVNTAIRYVLEMRDRTTDPIIRKNAERTLVQLMKW